ncbi:probable E3 ubiquitin-protein ligase HERC4 [Fundulus heteroclitus]|uniref:probable E3 ubiquitin-protein ligase HERC4 n=1 Tax=Fundulus heteroclitus TaxID=8078 RepID=UPI00165BA044|nr:probable E3 ubiquitin-protein ligase HERC4 [Fundulus heteroclitus]
MTLVVIRPGGFVSGSQLSSKTKHQLLVPARLTETMFAWGEDCQRGFWLKGDSSSADEGVHHLNVGYNVADLSAGRSVLAFVKSNGNAFVLRTHESKDGNRVRGKQKFVKCKEKIEAVSCEDDVVTLLSERGSVFCVDTTDTPYTPRILVAFSSIPVVQVACGSQHSVALTKECQVYTWGLDSRGQLGLGKRSSGARSPQHVRSLWSVPVVRISAGGDQSFALSVSGGVFGWGRNNCGQLGLGDTKDIYSPTCVSSLNLKKTCDICCGKDHTAILTKHGAVFTFGSGQYGQLGHNSSQNELHPRLVAELWGVKVIRIACGRYHTLVLTESRKVYAFGCGEQGQLGNRRESNPSVPLPVLLPHVSDSTHPKIGTIFAGENCSFATCSSDEDLKKNLDANRVIEATQHDLGVMVDNWTSKCDEKSWKKIKQEIRRTFSSASCLNKSFLVQRDKHFQTSPKYHGLNLKLARRYFKKLVKTEDVWEEVEAAVLHLLPLLHKNPVGVECLRIFLLLNELLHVIQKYRKQNDSQLAEMVAAAVTGLSRKSLEVLGEWWSSLSPSSMERYVSVWKQALSEILSEENAPRSSGVRNLLQVLQYMYNVNSRVSESRRLPESYFYLLINQDFLFDEVQIWRLKSMRRYVRAEPLVLCNFPIVMDLQAKKLVFDTNTDLTREEFQLSIFDQFLMDMFADFGWCYPNSPFLLLNLNRASVLKGTFKQLAAIDPRDYKRELVVFFDENYEIDNVYKKDFFHEVFHELLSAESEMFMFNDSQTLAWFSSKASHEDERFYLFGVLCGLALYNHMIVYLPFPLVLFKKLLGMRPSLDDLKEFSPIVGKSMQCILDEYTDEDLEYMYFSMPWDETEVALDPENPEKQLTSENKQEFVDAFVNHAFNASVEIAFAEFRRGFFQVCDRDLVRLFRPKELQEILVGKDFHDWEKLKQNTVYEGEYNADHPIIQMFWEVFDELTENQKKTFLWFVTGFERVPVLGLDTIKMKIKVKHFQDLSQDQYYPATHTCFSTLELPLYSTKQIMQSKLTEALSNKRISQCV